MSLIIEQEFVETEFGFVRETGEHGEDYLLRIYQEAAREQVMEDLAIENRWNEHQRLAKKVSRIARRLNAAND